MKVIKRFVNTFLMSAITKHYDFGKCFGRRMSNPSERNTLVTKYCFKRRAKET